MVDIPRGKTVTQLDDASTAYNAADYLLIGQSNKINKIRRDDFENGFSNRLKLLEGSAVAIGPHTGTTALTTLHTVAIPAGLLKANGFLVIDAVWGHNNNANTKTLGLKFGGSQFLAAGASSNLFARTNYIIYNRNSAASQIGLVASGLNSFAVSPSAAFTAAVNTAIAQNLEFTVQLANSGDNATLEFYNVWYMSKA